MNVVELDHVVARSIGLQAPVPAYADPSVVEVVNVVVRDAGPAALGDPDADTAGINPAAVEDVIVVHERPARLRRVQLCLAVLADPDAASAKIEQAIALDAAILAAAPEPDSVSAHVGHFTALDRTIQCAVCRDGCGDFRRRLRAAVALCVQHPVPTMTLIG